MKKKTDMEHNFKRLKRRNSRGSKLDESFLDDDKPMEQPADSLDVATETKEDDQDVEELIGDEESKENDKEKTGTSVNSDSVGELKDIISNLNTTVQTLADTIAKQAEEDKKKESPESGEEESLGDEFDDLDLGGDDEESEETGESEDEESTEEDGHEDETDSETEKGEESSGEEDEQEEGSDEEYAGDDEENKEKSEAYNRNLKHGKILNSNSGSLIGPLESGKTWKLDESILTLVKLKLRKRIEEAKQELRMNILKDSEGEL